MSFKIGQKVAICDPHCDILGVVGTITGMHYGDESQMLYELEGIPPDGFEEPPYEKGMVQPLGEFEASQLELAE